MSIYPFLTKREERKSPWRIPKRTIGKRVGYEYDNLDRQVIVKQANRIITKTEYLNDPLNITGCSQVLKQTEADIVSGEETVTTYVIGHQRISQIVVKNNTEQEYYFTFDGHGSTRVLLDFARAIAQLYSFDAYGNALGFDSATALTEFLYSGEQFDSKIGQLYLRQRYYDPATGRFNRLDPFFGNLFDPQSLHKYTYVHDDPINNFDPNGENAVTAVFAMFVGGMAGALFGGYSGYIQGLASYSPFDGLNDDRARVSAALWAILGGIVGTLPGGILLRNATVIEEGYKERQIHY
jgi:RHS repeat-associated protein